MVCPLAGENGGDGEAGAAAQPLVQVTLVKQAGAPRGQLYYPFISFRVARTLQVRLVYIPSDDILKACWDSRSSPASVQTTHHEVSVTEGRQDASNCPCGVLHSGLLGNEAAQHLLLMQQEAICSSLSSALRHICWGAVCGGRGAGVEGGGDVPAPGSGGAIRAL